MWKNKIGWVLNWAKEEQIVNAGNVKHVKKHLMHSVARGYLLIIVTGRLREGQLMVLCDVLQVLQFLHFVNQTMNQHSVNA